MKKIVIKGGYVKTKIEDIHEFNQEVNRGTGVIKPKKGKGSYNRKNKHQKSFSDNDFGAFFMDFFYRLEVTCHIYF